MVSLRMSLLEAEQISCHPVATLDESEDVGAEARSLEALLGDKVTRGGSSVADLIDPEDHA